MAAVSIQLMPRATACWMAAIESASSWLPHPVGPSATADGPRAEADLGDVKTARSERALDGPHHATSFRCRSSGRYAE